MQTNLANNREKSRSEIYHFREITVFVGVRFFLAASLIDSMRS